MTALGACRAAEGGGEAMSEAKPGMCRPERSEGNALIIKTFISTKLNN